MKNIFVDVILIIAVFSLVGCSTSTIMEIRGASRSEVVLALCKQDAYGLIGAEPQNFNESKTVIEYNSSFSDSVLFAAPIFNTTYMKDTVYIKEKDPNHVVYSLRCKSKTLLFDFFGLLTPYERSVNKERSIMIKTAEELYPLNVSIKWEDQWRRFIPVSRANFDDSLWFAYEAASEDLILEYFRDHGYTESYNHAIEKWTFTRHLTSKPDDWSKSRRNVAGDEWDSYEKIIVGKIIGGHVKYIIAVGVNAQVNPNSIIVKHNNHISDELRDNLVDNLAKWLEEKSETMTFVPPYLHVERINMDSRD